MPSLIPQRCIRIDDELYLKVRAIAKNQERSFNQQTIFILKKFVSDYEAEYGEIKVDTDVLYE